MEVTVLVALPMLVSGSALRIALKRSGYRQLYMYQEVQGNSEQDANFQPMRSEINGSGRRAQNESDNTMTR